MKVLLVHSGNAVNGDSSRYTFVWEQGSALEKQGCEIEYFAVVGKGLRGYLDNVKPLRKHIKEFQPDIIHAHYGLCGMVAVLASGKTPVVTTFHNGETLNWKVNLLCSFFAKKAAHVIYVAQHIYDKCFFKAKNYSILPCGVNMEDMVITPYEEARKQLGWSPDKKYILFGGSFSNKRKNYALLKDALSSNLLSSQPIEVIEMRGFTRAECVLRMCACDCFCLPSLSEGSPQALKEAMACNCPIVATDMADVKCLLCNLPGHFICSFSKNDVAKKIDKALKNNDRTLGRQRIINLGLTNDLVAKTLIDIYGKIL